MEKESKAILVRMPVELIDLLDKVAEARGEDRSTMIRRSVYKELAALSFLDEDQKKALGVKEAGV